MKKFLLFSLFISAVRPMFIGTATSSYQIEGHNKGISIWDEFTFDHNLHPVGNASNHFLQYKEDIRLIHEMGSRDYRFSISWTRIMPFQWNKIDPEGIQFYHNIIDECLSYNITPYVTLYHWDLPHYLNTKEINGWLDEKIIYYFKEYSIQMFEEYGDKVRYWFTINEPLTTARQGYGEDCSFAPYKCSFENQYLSAHYQLLAHAHVGHYYLSHHDGDIGLVINSNWFEPKNNASVNYANEYMDNTLGWFLEPLLYGDYPESMLEKTPSFTDTDKLLLLNSFSILAINHYTTYYVDEKNTVSVDSNWIQTGASWLYTVPFGAYKLFDYIHTKYSETLPIYITECGMAQSLDSLTDLDRIHYLSGYLYEIERLQHDTIKGFFVWSLLDNFEWARGFNESFGIIQVDYANNFERTPKSSFYFLKNMIGMSQTNTINTNNN